MEENLLYWFSLATQSDLNAADWYHIARAECLYEAAQLDLPLENFVFAVAALSPNCRWEDNIKGVVQLAQDGKTGYGFKVNREKALRCLAGDLNALKGQKVERFAATILFPDEFSDEVVVDVWATRAAEGRYAGEVKTLTSNQYNRIADAYRECAGQVGLTPAGFQAVVWTVVRNIKRKNGQLYLDI